MESKKEKILHVAEKLFAEKGYKGVSVRDITNVAKINVSAISYYFNGKKGLYLSVFRELWLKRAKLQREYLKKRLKRHSSLDCETFVKEVILSFLAGPISKYSKNHFALIQREILEPTQALQIVKKEATAPLLELLSFYIEKIFPKKFSMGQKRLYSITLIGIAIHFCLIKESLFEFMPHENQVEFISKNITDLLTYGLMGIKDEK